MEPIARDVVVTVESSRKSVLKDELVEAWTR
jgi:hypothetical protein